MIYFFSLTVEDIMHHRGAVAGGPVWRSAGQQIHAQIEVAGKIGKKFASQRAILALLSRSICKKARLSAKTGMACARFSKTCCRCRLTFFNLN